MNQVLKKTAALAILAFLLGFLINLIINNPYTHKMARGAILEKTSELTTLSIDFEALSVSVFPLEVTFYGVQVTPESEWPAQNLLNVSHIRIQISWWNLIIGRNRISSIRLHDLEARWPPPWDFAGFFKEPLPGTPDADSQPFMWPPEEIPVDEILISNGQFKGAFIIREELPAPLSQLYLDLAGFDLHMSLKSWRDIAITFQSPKSQLFLDKDQVLTNTRISGNVDMTDHEVKGNNIEISSPATQLKGKILGQMNLSKGILNSLKLDTFWTGYSELAILGSYLGAEQTRGKVNVEVSTEMQIPVSDNSEEQSGISGHAVMEDCYLGGFPLYDSETDFEIKKNQMIFKNTKVIKDSKLFARASGSLGFDDPLPYDFNLVLNDIPLSQLLDIFSTQLPEINFNMTSPGPVKISGTGFPFDMSVAGKTHLTKFNLPKVNYQEKPFRDSPQCEMDLELAINSDMLRFVKGSGQCKSGKTSAATASVPDASEGHLTSQLNLGGYVGFSDETGIDFTIDSPSLSLDLLESFLQAQANGSGSFSTRIAGPYGKVMTRGSVQGQNVSLKHIPLGEVSGGFTLSDSHLTWNNLKIEPETGGQIYSLKGGIYPENLNLSDTVIEADSLSQVFLHEFFKNLIPEPGISFGLRQGKINWRGSFLLPAKGLGSVELLGENLKVKGVPVADEFLMHSYFSEKTIVFEPVSTTYAGLRTGAKVEIKKSGKQTYGPAPLKVPWWQAMGLEVSDRIQAWVKTFPEDKQPQKIIRLPWFSQYLDAVRFRSGFRLDGQLEGTFEGIQGNFTGGFHHISINGASMPPAEFSGFFNKGALSMNLSHSGSSLEGRFAIDLSGDGLPYDWYLRFKRLDIRSIGTERFYKDPRNYAYTSGSWTMNGHLTNWWDSEGKLELDSIRAGFTYDIDGSSRKLALVNRNRTSLNFSQGGWTLNQNKPLELSGDYINIKLGLRESNPPEHLSFFMESEIDSGILTLFSKNIEGASGQFNIHASLAGPVNHMELTGRLFTQENHDETPAESGLRLSVPEFRPELRNLEFDIAYQKGYLNISKLSAIKGTGTLDARGTVRVLETAPVKTNVNLVMDQIKVIYPVPYLKSFDTILTGNIQMSGSEAPYLVSGDINIEKARSTRRFELREEVVNVIRQDSIDQAQKTFSENPYLQLNINFLAAKSISIHNSSMQLTLSTELRLEGDEQKQILLGHVEIEKGKVNYKREFTIQRGELTFDNPTSVDPRLDIVAVANVNPYKITVALSGPTSRPVIELLVDPPTKDDGTVISRLEAILLLTRGALPRQERKSAEATGLGISEVLNVYASQVPFEILSERFGQDLIHVYPDVTTDDSGSPVLQLNVPIKIYNDIEAIYRYTQNKSEVSLEVPVHNNISLSGSYNNIKKQDEVTDSSSSKDGSVDLKFRFPVK